MRSIALAALVAAGASFAAGAHEREGEGEETEGDRDGRSCSWTQWGRDQSHGGMICREAQEAERTLAEVTFDPFVAQEQADDPSGRNDLLAHYQVPLLAGDDVFMLAKAGSWTPCNPPGSGQPNPCGVLAWNSQIWTEKRFHWQGRRLVEKWSFASDWKPVPARMVAGWEPMFQPALAEDVIYIPGAGGTVHVVERDSGEELERINPFGAAIDPDAYLSGGITVDKRGNLYYNVLKLNHAGPFRGDAQSWLVRVTSEGELALLPYATLIPDAPAARDLCYANFFAQPNPPPFPWPPPPNPDGSPARPPQFFCGSQRPGVNVTPAVGEDGTVFLVSRAHFNQNYGYVIALRPDLSLKWASSLRDILHDGCGVLVPSDGQQFNCSVGATPGVDPITNLAPAGAAIDLASSSPVALPDGGVVYGTYTGYNEQRGHLFKFDAGGAPAGNFDFGWDLTPGLYRHDGTYSLVVKDNHYGTGGPYYLTQLSSTLQPEWRYQNHSTETCARQPDGSVHCVDDGQHPNGFEWCINSPAVDARGTVYGTSEDGNFYAIGQGGTVRRKVFLNIALGAAYTPLSIDPRGRIFALNNGAFTVLGE
jgi:hypothetical protein